MTLKIEVDDPLLGWLLRGRVAKLLVELIVLDPNA